MTVEQQVVTTSRPSGGCRGGPRSFQTIGYVGPTGRKDNGTESERISSHLRSNTVHTNPGDGDADTLEIKGHLGSWGSFINAKAELERGSGTVLWTSDKPVNIALNTEIVLNAPTPMFVFERDFLELGGEIIEVDDTFLNPDDILGNGTRKLPFDEIGEQIISVGFTSENQEVVARYLIDRVNVVEVA